MPVTPIASGRGREVGAEHGTTYRKPYVRSDRGAQGIAENRASLQNTMIESNGNTTDSGNERRYWQRNLRITGGLLALWFVVTFVATFFARELSFNFFGWPFSFWLASQGSLVVYLAIVWWYARRIDQLDREHGVAEDD